MHMLHCQAATGPGGAMSIQAYSSSVTLDTCKMTNNTAEEGGALYVRSSTSPVRLISCTASSNSARGDKSNKQHAVAAYDAQGVGHHGGALSMSGSLSELLVENCTFDSNTAEGQVCVGL